MGPKGWFWDEARLSGMYSHCLHAFRCSPIARIQVPITLLIRDKKSFRHSFDLQSTGSSKHGKGVNHLFFGDLHVSS